MGPYNYPLSPIQYPGITVIFKTFTFVLIDLLSPVMGRSTGSQGVKGLAYRVLGGRGIGLHGSKESRGRPTGSQRVKG